MWESRFLRDLGSAMASLLDGLVSIVAQEALKYTVLSGRRTVMLEPFSLLNYLNLETRVFVLVITPHLGCNMGCKKVLLLCYWVDCW